MPMQDLPETAPDTPILDSGVLPPVRRTKRAVGVIIGFVVGNGLPTLTGQLLTHAAGDPSSPGALNAINADLRLGLNVACERFRTEEDAKNFHDELVHLLVSQKASFNSPVWFNCCLLYTSPSPRDTR